MQGCHPFVAVQCLYLSHVWQIRSPCQHKMPLIACIHGGGSTAEIYKSQCAQLERLLAPDFRLVYFDGPFEHPPGYGILPAFRDYAPFKSWFKKDDMGNELSDGSGFDLIGRDGIERLLDLMEKQGDAADYVGAIGFSQGSRVVGGLLLDQQRREILGDHRNINLSFGVLCMGSGPPMESEIGHRMFTFIGASFLARCK